MAKEIYHCIDCGWWQRKTKTTGYCPVLKTQTYSRTAEDDVCKKARKKEK
jgi:hypothetical protein